MLSLAYTFKFSQTIQPKLVTIANSFKNILIRLSLWIFLKVNSYPSLVCSTVGGKVFYHTLHEKTKEDKNNNDITFLNINKNIIGLTSGRLDPSKPNDILILSSQNTLIAYGMLQFF